MKQPFMSVERLKNFNDEELKRVMGATKPVNSQSEQPKAAPKTEQATPSAPYDPNVYDSFVVSPDKLDDQILYGLSDLFDGKVSAMDTDLLAKVEKVSPNTVDKIMSSVAVAYITEDGIPVAGCTLRDPTTIDFRGMIPADYYEMKTGVNLENRLEQEFFQIHPDHHDQGLAGELRNLISTVVDYTFIVVPSNDTSTIIGLANAGYKMASKFIADFDKTESQLWLN